MLHTQLLHYVWMVQILQQTYLVHDLGQVLLSLLWVGFVTEFDTLDGQEATGLLVECSVDFAKSTSADQVVFLVLEHDAMLAVDVDYVRRDKIVGHRAHR